MSGRDKKCSNCKHYRGDDPAERYGNVGTCAFFVGGKADKEHSTNPGPFWAGALTARVSSHDGRYCEGFARVQK